MRKLIVLLLATALTAALAVPALGLTAPKKVTVGPASAPLTFGPKKLTIKKGTKVNFVWGAAGLPHNVTVIKGPTKFHSKTQIAGSYSHLFSKPGTYTLVCTIHEAEGMKMTITVT